MSSRCRLTVLFLVTVLFYTGGVWATTPGKIYNRPNPLMDYVPQEIGMGDYLYTSLGEDDCRRCHGGSLADRHHYSELALSQGLCTPCHDTYTGPANTPQGCTTVGCHSGSDLGPSDMLPTPPNGWHHYTSFSANDKCTACHDSQLIDYITNDEYLPFSQYPPSVVTPTPFSCESCHWEQPVVDPNSWTNGDGEPYPIGNEAHPSTYDHNADPADYNIYGSVTPTIAGDEYHEYGRDIVNNFDTHHMLFDGNVNTDCVRCHGLDPDDPYWDPGNPELIRYCETCHNIENLHYFEPHVGTGGTGDPPAVNGWQAVGFHVPDTNNTDTTDVAPTKYQEFSANQQCISCHGDCDFPNYVPCCELLSPIPKLADITSVATWDEIVTLTGSNFGDSHTTERDVFIKLTSGLDWNVVPISSWTDTEIQFSVFAWSYEIGNYHVQVKTENGYSNITVLTSTGEWKAESFSVFPAFGKCREIITVSVQSASMQDILLSGEGIYRAVQLKGPSGVYVASAYAAWETTDFKFRMGDVFEDLDNDYLRDTGEPLLRLCEGLPIGEYLIDLKDIYYQDSDGSNNYSEGDDIEKVETSGPASFTLESGLAVYAVYPRNIERSHYCPGGKLINGVAKIYGWGFGSTQGTGQVYIGTGPMYTSNSGHALERVVWSDNLIKVGMDVPPGAMGMTLYLWIEKDGQKTDASYGWPGIQILNSESCL